VSGQEVIVFGSSEFDARVHVVAIVVALALMFVTVELVRRRRLGESYSIVWLALGAIVVVFSMFRNLQEMLAAWIGVYYPPSLILSILSFMQLGVCLLLSTSLSRLERRNRVLVQRLALLEAEVRSHLNDQV
jgi:hypothetical protein